MYEYHVINGRISLVLEFCENGSLRQLLAVTPGRLLTEPVGRRYFGDMIEAVGYLHSQSVVHRDVRCENFVLDEYDRVKLCDFGTALRFRTGDELFDGRRSTGVVAAAGYWPPEMLEQKPYNPRQADIWALGVTLHVILTSRLPFSDGGGSGGFGGGGGGWTSSGGLGGEAEELKAMQRGLDFAHTASVRLSPEANELLRGLLHYVVQVRYSINRVRCSDWMTRPHRAAVVANINSGGTGTGTDCGAAAADKPYIGNFYLVAQPQKRKDGDRERLLKEAFGI